MKRTIYRDRKTGRFVSRKTWRRSRAHGGRRYARERLERKIPKVRRRKPVRPPAPPPKVEELFEWVIGFTYAKSGRTFDVIVTAPYEARALVPAREFLSQDAKGRQIVKAGFSGWDTQIAKGRPVAKAHEPEYRDESQEE